MNFVALSQHQADVIEPAQQTVFAKRVQLKSEHLAVGCRHGLWVQCNVQTVAGMGRDGGEQVVNFLAAQHHGEQAVLQGIVAKNIGEIGRDHGLYTVLQ